MRLGLDKTLKLCEARGECCNSSSDFSFMTQEMLQFIQYLQLLREYISSVEKNIPIISVAEQNLLSQSVV